MYKRFSLLLLFFLSVAGECRAQFDTVYAKTAIRRCADSLAHGFKTKNWELFTRYSYPAMVGSLGGKDAFIRSVSKTFIQVPDSAWKQYEPGSVLQVLKTATGLEAVIELKSVIEWQGKRVTSLTYLVATSWDGGYFWTFFDSQNDPAAAKQIKPDLSSDLVIPKGMEKAEPLAPRKN
jgi:hypothetical protein